MIYALCATYRSGSTYVQGLLQSTYIAGYPEELAVTPIMRRLTGVRFDASGPEIIDAMVPWFSTPNGVFGVQLMHPGEVDREYDFYLHLSRRDRVAQAVSMEIMSQTKRPYASVPRVRAQDVTVDYDRKVITAAAEEAERMEGAWSEFFTSHPCLELIYEDVVGDPQDQIDRALRYLRLDPTEARPLREMSALQGGAINEEWIQRYRSGQ